MKSTSKGFRITAVLMTALVFVVAGSYQAAVAAMIPTESSIVPTEASKARDNIKSFLARQDVQSHLVAKGIDPEEAKARAGSLTDAEVLMVSKHIDEMPAGGDAVAIMVRAVLIVFILLLITDLLGYTHVFSFVKKQV